MTYKHKVYHSLQVNLVTEVFMVSTREACADAVMEVHHTGHTVEAEAVELERLDPPSEVAQQETEDLMVAVVEQATVPEFMTSFASLVKILVIGAVKLVNTVQHVLASMGVDNIQEHCDPQSMCRVDEFLQVLGRTVPRTCSEKAGNLVAKR